MGLYNIIGNVAEMIDQEGIAKGGSWQHKLEDCNISKNITLHQQVFWVLDVFV
jgi:hypothetical protein